MFDALFCKGDYKIIGNSSRKNVKNMLSNLKYNWKYGIDLRDDETYWIIYNDGIIINTNDCTTYKDIKLQNIKEIIAFHPDIICDSIYEYDTIYK